MAQKAGRGKRAGHNCPTGTGSRRSAPARCPLPGPPVIDQARAILQTQCAGLRHPHQEAGLVGETGNERGKQG
jgi:hypothetical protein